MSQPFADYESQYNSGQSRHISFLPTSRFNRERKPQHQYTPSIPSLLSAGMHLHNRKDSSHSISTTAATSAATSRSSTSTSTSSHHSHVPVSAREASLRAQEIKPSADVAEWAHQMHITQGRSYWWCQGCFPKDIAEPLHIPKAVDKVVTGRRVRINEPSHCYDI